MIALDGKTVRGARTKNKAAPHLVAAYDHGAGAVLGQVTVAAKSNQIPAVQGLLRLFDLDGTVVTLDAMHTQTDTANLITAAGGDYTDWDNIAAGLRHHARTSGSAVNLLLNC